MSSSPMDTSTSPSSSSLAPAPVIDPSQLRENRFYLRPPQEFVDDIINAAHDYTGDACDEFEKALAHQIFGDRRHSSRPSGKVYPRQPEIANAITEKLFQPISERLKDLAIQHQATTLGLLAIPADVVLANEMDSDGTLGLNGDTEDSAVSAAEEAELAELQQQVANAYKLNREMRTSLMVQQAEGELYATHEQHFPVDKRSQHGDAQQLAQVETVAASIALLRPVHESVVAQFTEVYGAEPARELTATQTFVAPSSNTATAASAMNISQDAAESLF